MNWEPPQLSAAALEDEEEHKAFLARETAKNLAALEPPPQLAEKSNSHDTAPVTSGDLDGILEGIGQMIGAELKSLRQRIAELEQREWVGVWETGKSYSKNALVTCDGSCWVAVRNFPERRPG
jgi:hypothetical protein